MRIARRLIVAATIGGALFLGANIVAERVAEQRIGSEARRSFGTAATPEVHIEGFPILVKILQGKIPKASLFGRNLVIEDLRIEQVRIVLEGIRARLSDITQGKPIRVARGLATAEVTTANVNAYLRDRDREHDITLTIVPGKVIARGEVPRVGTGSAEGVPRVVGRRLTFRPDRVTVRGRPLSGGQLEQARRELSFEIDLPELPGGIRITAIQLEQGIARLIARFTDATLDLSG
ncbi:MAG: LmeA family phospholipid-binding protein [Actinomycetota bacterium]